MTTCGKSVLQERLEILQRDRPEEPPVGVDDVEMLEGMRGEGRGDLLETGSFPVTLSGFLLHQVAHVQKKERRLGSPGSVKLAAVNRFGRDPRAT
jgi:hypothetical protein